MCAWRSKTAWRRRLPSSASPSIPRGICASLPGFGSIAPGRYADIVLLSDLKRFEIAKVWADGQQVSEGKTYLPAIPQIDWPEWATKTINIGRALTAADFEIKAAPGRQTMQAAVLRPFHWADDF